MLATIDDLGDLSGKRVLLRSDLNVPLSDDGQITDDLRIQASLPTIRTLLDKGAAVIVCAHLGRPKGEPDPQYSLRPVADRLRSELGVGVEVRFAEDVVGDDAHDAVAEVQPGGVVLLENLRFEPGETSKDEAQRLAFAEKLAAFADAYVSDGFGVVHRKQASVYDVATLLPHAAGELVLAEVESLRAVRDDPRQPYVVILGGAKVSDKLGVIEALLQTADQIIVGGGMVFTFLKAQGYEIGKSLLEADQIDTVKGYLETAQQRGVEVILPTDIVAATAFSADADHEVVAADAIPADRLGLDIGPDSAGAFADTVAAAKTVFWNGPMGAFEMAPYAAGTEAVARALVTAHSAGATTVVGGGDSAAAVRGLGLGDAEVGHISTGGGASLEYLEGKELPGLQVLED